VQYPENGAYMIAAYTIAAVVVLVYAVSLFLRLKKVRGV
jgi:hypothetical protein